MGRIKKKGTSGAAKNYITRSRAVRKLQISLPDFRRLCIFKGIYPREPRNKKKVNKGSTPSTTFYYTKDIQYLLHEPLLNKFREHKAVAKKIARALGRGEVGDAARLEKTHIPKIKLDHVIKERYPTFVDALRDLDDALSMLFLFANLPSTQYVPAKTIALCQRLTHEFEHYVIVSHSLRKSFLSIKGIYYQATIQGQDIMWLVPYRFVQRTGGDIDFRIMGTFVEFYTTLLGFANFRLYTSLGLVYPPKFNAKSDEEGGELGAFQLEGRGISNEHEPMTNGEDQLAIASAEVQAEVDKVAALASEEQEEPAPVESSEEAENTDAIDTFEPAAQDADVLPQPTASNSELANLFAPFTFYLSRETPRAPLEFILKAFGSKRVGWDPILGDGAFTTNESDSSITHQIIDRPSLPAESLPQVPDIPETESGGATIPKAQWPRSKMPGRTYVQPQWVWDCINQGKLLRPDLYAPGAESPPHLSPWVKPKKGQYDPNLPLEAQEPEGEAEMFEDEGDGTEDETEAPAKANGTEMDLGVLDRESDVQAGEGMDVDDSDNGSEGASEDEDEEGGDWDGIDQSDAESDISESEAARRQHQRELEAEATGKVIETETPSAKAKNAEIRKKVEKKRKAEKEEKERQKMMLSQKKRKLLERIEFGEGKRDREAEKLRKKKRRIEKAKMAAEAV